MFMRKCKYIVVYNSHLLHYQKKNVHYSAKAVNKYENMYIPSFSTESTTALTRCITVTTEACKRYKRSKLKQTYSQYHFKQHTGKQKYCKIVKSITILKMIIDIYIYIYNIYSIQKAIACNTQNTSLNLTFVLYECNKVLVITILKILHKHKIILIFLLF